MNEIGKEKFCWGLTSVVQNPKRKSDEQIRTKLDACGKQMQPFQFEPEL